MEKELKALYESVDRDFYLDQTKSKNPLRKWFHLNRYRIANSLVKAKYKKGYKILDLGCGSCDWNREHLDVFGVDLNKNMLEAAKNEHRLTDYKIAEAHDTGLPSETFDIATAFEFLEHMPNYEEVIDEAERLLKPGGYFVASVPYDVVFSLWQPLFLLHALFQGYVLQKQYYKNRCGHVNHFSIEAITNAFVKHGYSIEIVFDMRKFTIFLYAKKEGLHPADPSPSYDDLTIIMPTLNEEKGLSKILPTLISRYKDCSIIISDDSSKDSTKEVALSLQYEKLTFIDRASRPIHGLTASVVEAAESVKTKHFIVMDADGQHPPEKIEEIVNIMRLGANIVVASRIAVKKKWGSLRKMLSYMGTSLGKTSLLLRGKSYLSYDILGGFFGCNSNFWNGCVPNQEKKKHFRLRGYKVMFDLLKCAPSGLEIEEVFYRFETPNAGTSKINLKVCLEYLKSCLLP